MSVSLNSTPFDRAIRVHLALVRNVHARRCTLERIAAETTRAVFAGNSVIWCGNSESDSHESAVMTDIAFCIALKDPARIEEGHILCGQIFCDWSALSEGRAPEQEVTSQ